MLSTQLDLFEVFPVQSKKVLRKYQKQAIEDVINAISKGTKNTALIMPTGAGKTLTLAKLISTIGKQYNWLCLVPRRKLKRQMSAEFRIEGISAKIVKTAQSVTDKKLFEQGLYQNLDFIVLDECHELAWWEQFNKLRSLNPNAVVIGLTATPDRSSRKQYFEDKFDEVIYPISFGDLVNDGYLCNPRYFAYGNEIAFNEVGIDSDGGFIQEQLDKQCEKQHFNESIVKNLIKHDIQNRRSIIFCSSIKQSKQLTDMLNAVNIPTIHVDGNMTDIQQENAIQKVANGEISAISCAKLLIAGFDEPRIDTVILATATNSPMNLIQMCGRGSRIHADKLDEFWIFDFGDNFARLQIGLKQKFPFKTKDSDFETKESALKPCPECGVLNYNFVSVCKSCGFIFPKKPKPVQDLQDLDIVEVEADLQDLYHIKQVRRIIRSSYEQDKIPFVEISKYLYNKNIRFNTIINPSTIIGSIFKKKNLENLLDYSYYIDKHILRLKNKKFTLEEKQWLDNKIKKESLRKQEIENWISVLISSVLLEFGKKFMASRIVKKYLPGKGTWQEVLGIMQISNKEMAQEAYKRKWFFINAKLAKLTDLGNGEFNPDKLIESLDNSEDLEVKDLRQQILVLEWAYQYVNLVYP